MLITLAIIGIIAALTVPTLMKNHQRKVYETSFKRAYNMLSLGVQQMIQENGSDIYSIPDNTERQKAYILDFAKYLGGAHGSVYLDWGPGSASVREKKVPAETLYNGTKRGSTGCPQFELILKNSMELIIRNQCFVSARGVLSTIIIDTNTLSKGPNRWGYDTWAFTIDEKKKILVPDGLTGAYYGHDKPFKCGSNGSAKYDTDYGCSYYAVINKCPDDDTKTYWECLN